MGNVFRISFMKMLVLLKLAIVASLALYTLPSASYAMHGDPSSAFAARAFDGHETTSDVASARHAHHEHAAQGELSEDDHGRIKQECCSDLCISLAIVGSPADFWRAFPRPIRDFRDDASIVGQLTTLHRPPSMRA